MASLINPLLALIATGHAFDKHVLGKDGGDREFSDRRFGAPLNVASYKDAAKLLQDIVRDKENTVIAYNADECLVSLANTAKNVYIAIDAKAGDGDCGSFYRPQNPSNNPEQTLDCLVRKTEKFAASEHSYTFATKPEEVSKMVDEFTQKIRVCRQAIRRLKEPEVREVIDMLNKREETLDAQAEAKANKRTEDKMAEAFIRFAKKAAPEDYDIEISGEGRATVTYIQKEDLKEVQLSERNTKKVVQALNLAVPA